MTPIRSSRDLELDETACLDFLSELVRFRSQSNTPGEIELARFLGERIKAIGLETTLQPVEGDRLNALGLWRGTGGGRSLLFNGHLDTNPVTEGWTVDPWSGLRDDRFVYGIGVSNMKAGDAAFYCAVKTLLDHGVKLRGDVHLSFVVGELQGGIGTLKLLESGLRADAFLVAEPTDLAALTLHAGALGFVVELTGETRHVSKREEAVDALAAACDAAIRIRNADFSGSASPEYRSLNRAHVGVLRAALTPEFRENRPPQVADFARLAGTVRYAPDRTEESALAELRTLVESVAREYPGLKVSVFAEPRPAGRPGMGPFEVARDEPVVRSLGRAYWDVRGTDQPAGAIRPACYFVTDASHLSGRGGMSGVVCGPGGRYNTMPDERVDIPDYLDAVRIYMRLMMDFCG